MLVFFSNIKHKPVKIVMINNGANSWSFCHNYDSNAYSS